MDKAPTRAFLTISLPPDVKKRLSENKAKSGATINFQICDALRKSGWLG